MSSYPNGNWHGANGGGLPFRPPTVEEALPYSPFTSVVPFSPDVIPFPTTDPPTPPTTLSPEQQSNAKKATGILNEEIRNSSSGSQHLQATLRELQQLMNPDELPDYHFKSVTHLATPPPDDSSNQSNGSVPTKAPALSQFASMLLKNSTVYYQHSGNDPAKRVKVKTESHTKPPLPQPAARTPQSQSHVPTPTPPAAAHNGQAQAVSSSQPRPNGPAVVIKPLPPTIRREEYQRFDNIVVESLSQKRVDDSRSQPGMPAMRPREREIAEDKIDDLRSLVERLSDERDDCDESRNFTKFNTIDSEFTVLEDNAIARLSNSISEVVRTGAFAAVPIETILQIQALCDPSISATIQLPLEMKADEVPQDDDLYNWLSDVDKSESGLKASRLALDTMIKGRDDRRICPEDLVISIIQATKHVLNSCIIPVVGSSRSGASADLFNMATKHGKRMHSVLRICGSIFSRLATLIGKINLADTALNPIAYLAVAIIVEQNSESEKDSVFGIQKFESFRQKAMEILAQIFACRPDQRSFIITEILTNLEKLPDKRASARQFKSAREAPIMLVSALFMRFVQVAATNRELSNKKSSVQPEEDDDEDADGDADSDYEAELKSKNAKAKAKANKAASQLAQKHIGNATAIAHHIAKSLVDRSLNVSKTGDKPFRNLLDLFIEDYCNVLGSPEWPAAVILLQQLLSHMSHIQTSDPATNNKDMALGLMARMGCGIIDFRLRMKDHRKNLDISESDLSARLHQLADDALSSSGVNKKDLLAFDGPYRMVLESLPKYLNPEAGQEDPHLQSVIGCHVTSWLHTFNREFQSADGDDHAQQPILRTKERLEAMIMDPAWLSREYKFQDISVPQGQIAAGIITLQDPFCRVLPKLIHIMINYTRDKSSKLISRALNSLTQIIEKDARAIDEQTIVQLTGLTRNPSPQVRATTISMISKCLDQNPSLEKLCLNPILHCTKDQSTGPKKAAIKLLKDLYLRSSSKDNQLLIAASLLPPSQDDDKAIADLTRQVLEDIWMKTPSPNSRTDNNQLKLSRSQRASLLVDTVQKIQAHPAHIEAFERFFIWALSSNSKSPAEHTRTCKELIAELVDNVIGSEPGSEGNAQAHILQTLSIFAKVFPNLFTYDQVQLLKPYIKDLASSEDLSSLRPTVTIFRFVLPLLPSLQESFAEEVRASLSKVISKLASWAAQASSCKDVLLDVAHCLWTICPLTTGGIEKLIILISSVLSQLLPLISASPEVAAKKKNNIISYLVILGTFGKVCDFDSHIDVFQKKVPVKAQALVNAKQASEQQMKPLLSWKGASACVLILDTVRPFTMQSWDMTIREHALCSVGEICQRSPALFMRAEVEKVFKLVFVNRDNYQLKRAVLHQMMDYFSLAERRSETGAEIAVGEGAVHGAARLGVSFQASGDDTATLHLGRKFLPDVVNMALKNKDDLAFIATKIIASISRQGLVHPKECGPALVALGTSSVAPIAQCAFVEHQKIHAAHETMFEKEYMSAVRLAFEYQRDVFDSPYGLIEATFKPKMGPLFEILKNGSRKTLKKFLENICKQFNFEMSKLDITGAVPDPVLYARFCLENVALFDYQKVEEVVQLNRSLENIYLKHTGPAVALAIETELPKISQLQQPSVVISEIEGMPMPPPELPVLDEKEQISEERLRRITTAAMILQTLWEARSFLRRIYNMTKDIPQKDNQKPTTRLHFISGKELWDRLTPIMGALESRDTMLKACFDFAKDFETDRDAKIEEEDAGGGEGAGFETPDEDGEGGMPSSGRGRKRKSVVSLGNTPKKSRGRPLGAKGKARKSHTPEAEGQWD
ncbi:hypothetical protein BS50DRAFT_680336 [Corynespora cassiicola Philippines]|uniref:Sister chromatid cohesion protein n=1 Tax=Corynespora cassiicola Philippines TaxID=1448308 RepID=A0A2T2N998_CORCC|nr:hypothetical protein BS50DRAFT_680336 [Corynespora cassiicola Philippines]